MRGGTMQHAEVGRYGLFFVLTCLVATTALAGGWRPRDDVVSEVGSGGFFKDKTPEHIAPYVTHPHLAPQRAAVRALAGHGKAALPIVEKLLTDSHPGLRTGGVDTLIEMQRQMVAMENDVDAAYRADLAALIKRIRLLVNDKNERVRAAVAAFAGEQTAFTPEVLAVLYAMAQDPYRNVRNQALTIMRHKLVSANVEARVKVCALSCARANQLGAAAIATDFRLRFVTTAYLELSKPCLQASIDIFKNPHVLVMWGMFSNQPTEAAVDILEQWYDDPRVLAALPDVLHFSTRKVVGGNANHYWAHLLNGPRRLILKIGPKAAPTVEAFVASERKVFEGFLSGQAQSVPVNDWSSVVPGYRHRLQEIEEALTLARALHGDMPLNEAIPTVCRIYLERDWSDRERAIVREYLLDQEHGIVDRVSKALPAARVAAANNQKAHRAALLLEKKNALKTAAERNIVSKGQAADSVGAALKSIDAHAKRLDELVADLESAALLAEALRQTKPSDKAAKFLCAEYLRRNWPGMRVRVLRLFESWGPAGASVIRSAVQEEEAWRDAECDAGKALEAKGAVLLSQTSQGGGKSMIADGQVRQQEAHRLYGQLDDMATYLKLSDQSHHSPTDLKELCRILTRRGWEEPSVTILQILKKNRAQATALIAEYIRREEEALTPIRKRMDELLGYTVRYQYRREFHFLKPQYQSMTSGLAALHGITSGSTP